MSNIIRQTQLANGLQLLGEVNPNNQSAAIGFFVKTGSRDETVKEAGISHFLEHMMFRRTAKRSALDILYDMCNIGSSFNAITGYERTVFYGAILTQYFPQMQEILCDMLRPALDQHEFDTEKNVILEEISLYQEDMTYEYFKILATTDFFGEHPASKSVLGTLESVSAIQRDEMLAYFERRYAPNNMVLVATGNFDWDRFVADAEKYCSSWKPFDVGRTLQPFQPKELNLVYRKKDITQAHLLYMTGCCNVTEDERFAYSLLSMILGDGVGSKLYWALVDSGIAECASCDDEEKDDVGCFSVYAAMEPEKIDQVADIIRGIISKPLDFTADELQRAKTKLTTRIAISGETPRARMNAIGSAYLARKCVCPVEETIAKVNAVTKADIEAAISKYGFGTWSEFRMLAE